MNLRAGSVSVTEVVLAQFRSDALHVALRLVAPGTPLREGIDRILQANMGALILIGDGPEVLAICSGGFLLDVGWGTYGFKAGPVSGEAMAQCIADGKPPEIISAFGLDRFSAGTLVGEKGAAAVGH